MAAIDIMNNAKGEMTRSRKLRMLAEALDEQLALNDFAGKCKGAFAEAVVKLRFKIKTKDEVADVVYKKLDDNYGLEILEERISKIVARKFKDLLEEAIADLDAQVRRLERSLESDGCD
jgi:hypothetical protein